MSIQNFRPIPTITVASDYWENKKWRFNVPEITVGTGATPQPIEVTVKGIGAVTLVNAIDDGLLSLTLFGGTEQLPETYLDTVTLSGGCEQSGTPTPSQPLDIICNNGAIKVSKNLFNQANATTLNLSINGTTLNTTSNRYGWAIPVKGSTTYTISKADERYLNVCLCSQYPVAGLTISYLAAGLVTQYTVTTAADTTYLYLYAGSSAIFDNLQVEKGSTPTTYRPYGQIYTQGTQEVVTDSLGNTASAERLLSVGDYKDTQKILSGLITRNVGIRILNGTEGTDVLTTYNYGTNSFMVRSNPISGEISSSDILTYCTHFNSVGFNDRTAVSNNLCYIDTPTSTGSTKHIILRNTAFTSLENFKTFLQNEYANGTPFMLVFPLGDTSTTESVSRQVLTKSPVTQTAGTISGLTITTTESAHTTPTPQQPLPINCNNGVAKAFGGNKFTTDGEMVGYIISSGTGEITESSTSYNVTAITKLLKGNYTASFASSSTAIGNRYFRCWSYQSDGTTPIAEIFNEQELSKGETKTFTFTVDNDCDVRFSYNSSRFSDINVHPTNPIIYTDDTVETVAINIFNQNNYLDAYCAAGGKITSSTTSRCYIIPCKPLTEYRFIFDNTNVNISGRCVINGFYNMPEIDMTSNQDIYTSFTKKPHDKTFTTDTGINYLLFWITFNSSNPSTQRQIDKAILYEIGSNTATAENLFAIDAYKDVQEVLAGNVTRNIGIKVLDGTEDWSLTGTSFRFDGNVSFAQPNTCLCTHFKGWLSSDSINDMPDLTIKAGHPTNTYRVYMRYDRFTTAEQLKSWLAAQYNAGTPCVIVYPLETPTTESVTAQPMSINAGTNIVQITQASMDDLELEVKYKAGVTVTITEIENAQLDNNVEVTING